VQPGHQSQPGHQPQPGQQSQPGQGRAFGGPQAPTQGYPVQYAAGPGQQHANPQHPNAQFTPYGQQPGGAPTGDKKKKLSWGTAITAGLIGAAVATLLTLAVSGQFVRPVYTGATVEEDVQGVLEDEYGLPDVQDVTCPEQPSASAGAEFACGFTTGDRKFSVQIRVLDSGGQYLVGAVSSGD
jgi:hypothetical protein